MGSAKRGKTVMFLSLWVWKKTSKNEHVIKDIIKSALCIGLNYLMAVKECGSPPLRPTHSVRCKPRPFTDALQEAPPLSLSALIHLTFSFLRIQRCNFPHSLSAAYPFTKTGFRAGRSQRISTVIR